MAIIFSVGLIFLWLLVGLSLFAILRFRANYHLRLLLAPALGLAISIVALFILSRIGLPIKLVAIPLFLVQVLLSGYFLLTQKILWKRQASIWFSFFIILPIIPFGLPLLKFGFEWLAFVNGDMSYYSLSSSRFLDFGYSELPVTGNIFDDRDHSLAYWFFPNELGHRSGADLLLAQLVGVTGLTAHQVYMPLIISCHMSVAVGAGALALLGSRRWDAALWAIVLTAISPMLTLEVTMQLLAQAIGLVFLTSLCVSYVKAMLSGAAFTWKIVTVLLFSGLAIAYSELIPFFGFFVVVTEVVGWKRWMVVETRQVYLRTIMILVFGVILILNSYIFDVLNFVMLAMDGSFKSAAMTIQSEGLSLFPYFFVPSNGALLWGWMPLSGQVDSWVIVFGLIATTLFVGAVFFACTRGIPSAQMSVGMILVAASMYIGGNGFGLFKIAMFIQPFLHATIVVLATLYVTRELFRWLGLALLGLTFVPAQIVNINRVTGDEVQGRVPYASTARFGEQLRKLARTAHLSKSTRFYSDTPSRELFLLQSYYFKGMSFSAASLPATQEKFAKQIRTVAKKNNEKLDTKAVSEYEFDFKTGESAKFKQLRSNGIMAGMLISSSNELSPINRFNQPAGRKFYLWPIRDLRNYLVFKQTSLGTSYVGPTDLAEGGVVYWGVEPDPMFFGQTMSSVGRYHLYEVWGSQPESRILLTLSASMSRNDDFRLPNVKALGRQELLLPLIGRGSARVVSLSSLSPREIAEHEYIGIDFGRQGSFVELERSGALGWFGGNIKLDIRKMVVFARDISYITADQYAGFDRPQLLQSFPTALENPNLEYSGIFEDGWISDVAYVILKAPAALEPILYFTGQIPDIDGAPFNINLTIRINDQLLYSGTHGKGIFKVSIPITDLFSGREAVKIQIESSALQRLPNGDGRPVSLHIGEIGFGSDSH